MDTAIPSNRADFGLRRRAPHGGSRAGTGVDQELLALFIGRNVASYQATLVKMQAKDASARKKAFDFCWPAFLFTVPWLLYRKLWGVAAVLILVPMLGTYLLGSPVPSIAASLTIQLLFVLFGKSMYIQDAIKRIDRITREESDPVRARERIRRTGGVSVAGAVLGAVITLVPQIVLLSTLFR